MWRKHCSMMGNKGKIKGCSTYMGFNSSMKCFLVSLSMIYHVNTSPIDSSMKFFKFTGEFICHFKSFFFNTFENPLNSLMNLHLSIILLVSSNIMNSSPNVLQFSDHFSVHHWVLNSPTNVSSSISLSTSLSSWIPPKTLYNSLTIQFQYHEFLPKCFAILWPL
jgi:hypothetical protein